jgi:hypothetical protein
MNDESKKPHYLYRGIVITQGDLSNFSFSKDLLPPQKYCIDEYGRKTVEDGNEYGIYMSDNELMVLDAYGAPKNSCGELVSKTKVGSDDKSIAMPGIGIVYKIDTQNLDVKRPFICNHLNGVYNNGYIGEEWIAQYIPSSNYQIMQATIGKDIIHDKETIVSAKKEDLNSIIQSKLTSRRYHLLSLATSLNKTACQNPYVLREISYGDIGILKKIFGDNGLAYSNLYNIEVNDISTMRDYLMCRNFSYNQRMLNFSELRYINGLGKNIENAQDFDSLLSEIRKDISLNALRKKDFIEKNNGRVTSTESFDRKSSFLDSIYNQVNSKIEKSEIKDNCFSEETKKL